MVSTVKNGFEDLDTIRGPDNLIAIISRRRSNGTLALGLFKEFERDGGTEKTAFFNSRHIDAAIEILRRAKLRIVEIEAGAR